MESSNIVPFEETVEFAKDFFHRRRFQMLRIGLSIYAFVFLFVVFWPPSYYARSIVEIDARRNVLDDQRGGVMNYLMPTDDTVETEITNIGARENVEAVVKNLHLDSNNKFTKVKLTSIIRDVTLYAGRATRAFIARVMDGLTGQPYEPGHNPGDANTPQRRAEDNLLGNLKIQRVGQSYAIEVGFKWGDPVVAAQVINELIRVHEMREGDLRRQVRESATGELVNSLATHRVKIANLEGQLADARAHAGILNLQSTAVGGDIGALKAQQASASADAALASIRNQTEYAESAVNSSPTIQQLRTQLSLARSDATINGTRYGPDHPLAQEARNKIAALQSEIARQSATIRQSALAALQVEAKGQSSRAATEQGALKGAQADLNQSLTASGQLAQLEHQRDFEVETYEADFDRYKRILNTLDSVGDLTISSVAAPPQLPSMPKVKLFLALGVVLAVIGAVMLAVVFEILGVRPKRSQTYA